MSEAEDPRRVYKYSFQTKYASISFHPMGHNKTTGKGKKNQSWQKVIVWMLKKRLKKL